MDDLEVIWLGAWCISSKSESECGTDFLSKSSQAAQDEASSPQSIDFFQFCKLVWFGRNDFESNRNTEWESDRDRNLDPVSSQRSFEFDECSVPWLEAGCRSPCPHQPEQTVVTNVSDLKYFRSCKARRSIKIMKKRLQWRGEVSSRLLVGKAMGSDREWSEYLFFFRKGGGRYYVT